MTDAPPPSLDVDQTYRSMKLTIDGKVNDALLLSFHGTEALSQPFFYQLELLSLTEEFKPDKLVHSDIIVELFETADPLSTAFHGKILSMTRDWQGEEFSKLFRYRLEIVPEFWFMQYNSKYRMFYQLKTSEILAKVFSEYGLKTGAIPATSVMREYCVQYGESDFDFVSRLMEEEGIFYYFERTKSSHEMKFGNKVNDYKELKSFKVLEDKHEDQHISHLENSYEVTTSKKSIQIDDDYRNFGQLIESESPTKVDHLKQQTGEIREYAGRSPTGEYASSNVAGNKHLAEVNQLQREASAQIVRGSGRLLMSWSPGDKVKFEDVGSICKEQVLTSLTHDYREPYGSGDEYEEDYFETHFTAIDSTRQFCPPCLTPKPRIYGAQSATVVDVAEGGLTSNCGEVKIQFHWAQDSSCWVRVAQPWASNSYGTLFLPRVGDEVIVQFLNGDPERPVIVGSVYNNKNVSPFDQTATDFTSGIWTQNDNGNHVLKFNDISGSEAIVIDSRGDFERIVKQEDKLTVEEGSREINVDQGNYKLTVKSGNIEIEAGNTIILKVGANSITIESGGITIEGTKVEVKGTASAKIDSPMSEFSGSGQATIKGGIVMIN